MPIDDASIVPPLDLFSATEAFTLLVTLTNDRGKVYVGALGPLDASPSPEAPPSLEAGAASPGVDSTSMKEGDGITI
jgi:hypothetical protein